MKPLSDSVSSGRSAGQIRDNFRLVRVVRANGGPVCVVVLDIVVEELFEWWWFQISVRSRTSRRMLPTQRSAYAFATGVYAGCG
jgi:hypothetical protein